jgi:hypothetical protein
MLTASDAAVMNRNAKANPIAITNPCPFFLHLVVGIKPFGSPHDGFFYTDI